MFTKKKTIYFLNRKIRVVEARDTACKKNALCIAAVYLSEYQFSCKMYLPIVLDLGDLCIDLMNCNIPMYACMYIRLYM